MHLKSIDYNQLPFSELFKTYVNDFQKLRNFYSGNPLSEDELVSHYQNYFFKGDREKVANLLKQFNEPFHLHSNALDNIEKLKEDDTVTIVTGQQLGIYGGPLYTIFKAMTTIILARNLSGKTGKNVVPVFWLADEDHDYQEVAGVNFPNRNNVSTVVLPGFENNKKAVSDLVIPDNFEEFRNGVREKLQETDFSEELWQLLDKCYQPGKTFRYAFGTLIGEIFSKHGMILAGSHDRKIKRYLSETIIQSARQAQTIGASLLEKSTSLADQFHQQAQIDPSLLFIFEEDGRNRISFNDHIWSNNDGQEWSTEELIDLIRNHPEHFSPNVFLRPVLQDKLLPNAAYVAGPGELAYYGQMKNLYPVFDLEMPLIVPRFSATMVESSVSRVMKELPFRFNDYNQRIEDLESEYVSKSNTLDVNAFFNEWKKEIAQLANVKTDIIKEVDKSLKGAAEKASSSYYHALDGLKGKVFRSIKQQNDIQLKRIQKIHMNLFPNQELQERKISFIYFMNKYGVNIWDQILDMLDEESLDSHKVIYL